MLSLNNIIFRIFKLRVPGLARQRFDPFCLKPTALSIPLPSFYLCMSTTTSTNPTPAPNDNRLITVFESTEQYNIKHPLNYPWSLWLKAGDKEPAGRHGAPPAAKSQEQEPAEVPDKPKTSMELWAEKVQHIGTVGTVEDFWWYTYPNISYLYHM